MAIRVELIVEDIKKEFEELMKVKTGWGYKECIANLDKAIVRALAKNIDAY